MGLLESFSFSCTHWALGSLVLIGLASSEFSGAGSVVALPIVAIAINLSALCGNPSPSKFATRRRKCNQVVDFLVIWTDILEHMASAATCARVASATIDYTSRGKFREWLLGIESHSLGEPWPDVLGVTIIIIVTTLFMLGLENSTFFSIILYVGVATSYTFFIGVGGYHTDIKFWNWTDDFELRSWSCVLTTAAMCSFGFGNTFPEIGERHRRLKIAAFLLVPLLCYSLTALIFTLMSDYRELAGTAIPLVRIFEVRDVDWARPVMAACTICVVCVALTEIIPALCTLFVQLAEYEWQVLVTSLLYKNSLTGAPILAIFAAGSLTSILAFACPLTYLVRLLNVAPLTKCALRTCKVLYDRFKPEFSNDSYSVYPTNSNVQYSKLNQSRHTNRFKAVFDVLPKYLKRSASCASVEKNKSRKVVLGIREDKEYLLLGDYTNNADEFTTNLESSDSEDDLNLNQINEEESSSSTDIDAVVQEYKERIHVATVNSFPDHKTPTVLSSLLIIICLLIIISSASVVTVGIFLKSTIVSGSAILVLLTVLIIIHIMPQNAEERSTCNFLPPQIFPICAITSISLCVILACTLIEDIWPGLIFWTLSGLILFWRCDCCTCEGLMVAEKDRMRLTSSKRDGEFKEVQIDKHVDTILIAR